VAIGVTGCRLESLRWKRDAAGNFEYSVDDNEVIEVVQAYRPHVVFLDLGMPAPPRSFRTSA